MRGGRKRRYEMNRSLDVLDEGGAALVVPRLVPVVPPHVLRLHQTAPVAAAHLVGPPPPADANELGLPIAPSSTPSLSNHSPTPVRFGTHPPPLSLLDKRARRHEQATSSPKLILSAVFYCCSLFLYACCVTQVSFSAPPPESLRRKRKRKRPVARSPARPFSYDCTRVSVALLQTRGSHTALQRSAR